MTGFQPVFLLFFKSASFLVILVFGGIFVKRFKVGIIGATGIVGQRFITLLHNHPWFEITVLAASNRSSGKKYMDAVENRWAMKISVPNSVSDMIVLDAIADVQKIVEQVDFVFCAVDMKKDDIKKLEEQYAKAECPVISNNSAHRFTPDVPMIIPEINPEHIHIIEHQRKRLGVKKGFIAVKSNCSLQSYVPALHPLFDFGITNALACTYQAISGAGKTFETWPEMLDNVIPYIGGEEEKSEKEPLKIWGKMENGMIIPATTPNITTQCIRVPVSDGHLAAVFASFEKKPELKDIIDKWNSFKGRPQELHLPSAPKQFLTYFEEDNRPQIKLDRDLEGGMGVSIGRLRADSQYDVKFICLSHNTLRGAAGGAVLMAELLCAEGYIS
jgi:aspartate-semialdehyde dehydrogenase